MIFVGVGLSIWAATMMADSGNAVLPLTCSLILTSILMLGAIRLLNVTLERTQAAKTSLEGLASQLNGCSDSYMYIDTPTTIGEFTDLEERIDFSVFIHKLQLWAVLVHWLFQVGSFAYERHQEYKQEQDNNYQPADEEEEEKPEGNTIN